MFVDLVVVVEGFAVVVALAVSLLAVSAILGVESFVESAGRIGF